MALGEQLVQKDSDWIISRELLGCAYGAAGRIEDARRILSELEESGVRKQFVPAIPMVTIFASIGDFDAAIGWLEKAIERREPILAILKVWPAFDPIRIRGIQSC